VSYSYYYNKKYERTGHLFQDRFKSEPVNDMNYFVTLFRYIHQNPVKAGIVTDIDYYPWSSWDEYRSVSLREQSVCTTEPVLRRMTLEKLTALVKETLNDSLQILDFDNDGKFVFTDDDIRILLSEDFGINNPKELQNLPKAQRNRALNVICDMGATIRQTARLTGISFGIIQKLRRNK